LRSDEVQTLFGLLGKLKQSVREGAAA
jgi:hypothetical protein